MSKQYGSYPTAKLTFSTNNLSYVIISYYGNTLSTSNTITSSKLTSGFYSSPDLSFNTLYTFTITPYNNNNISGSSKVVTIDTTLSVPGTYNNSYSTQAITKLQWNGGVYDYMSLSRSFGIGNSVTVGSSIDLSTNVQSNLYLDNDISGNTTFEYAITPYKTEGVASTKPTPIRLYTNPQVAYDLSTGFIDASSVQVYFTPGKNSYNTVSYRLRDINNTAYTIGTSSPLLLTGLINSTNYNIVVDTNINDLFYSTSSAVNVTTKYLYGKINISYGGSVKVVSGYVDPSDQLTYTYFIFKSGTCFFNFSGNGGTVTAYMIAVGGGGASPSTSGNANNTSGGGGGGGVVQTTLSLIKDTFYISIGNGGTTSNGGNTTILSNSTILVPNNSLGYKSNLIALGGGCGGTNSTNPTSGSSGGGAPRGLSVNGAFPYLLSNTNTVSISTTTTGSQGYSGGNSANGGWGGGGGGGAGAVGGIGNGALPGEIGGKGGDGVMYNLYGFPRMYFGGGGGGCSYYLDTSNLNKGGNGGKGGGGGGSCGSNGTFGLGDSNSLYTASNGTAGNTVGGSGAENSGGGGGGTNSTSISTPGGSGVVIIAIPSLNITSIMNMLVSYGGGNVTTIQYTDPSNGIVYTNFIFTGNGTFNYNLPSGSLTIYILAVGGGGCGGGNSGGGGGGGGGVVQSELTITGNNTLNINVGLGNTGVDGTASVNSGNGYPTIITFFNNTNNNIIAYGGGGGGTSNGVASNGASGGGSDTSTGAGTGITGQGYSGGTTIGYGGGGGGGAGGPGGSNTISGSNSSNTNYGGPGIQYSLYGINKSYYWGGGGGGSYQGNGGIGGGGGGGSGSGTTTGGGNAFNIAGGFSSGGGAASTTYGGAGAPNSGGGGGGGDNGRGGAGGSGIVIISIPSTSFTINTPSPINNFSYTLKTITGASNLNFGCCSYNGQYVYYTSRSSSSVVYYSSNYGASFSTATLPSNTGASPFQISCNTTGQYVWIFNYSTTFFSNNYGVSFITKFSNTYYSTGCVSADGTKLVAGVYYGSNVPQYCTNALSASPTMTSCTVNGATSGPCISIYCSDDFKYVYFIRNNTYIYLSTDGNGATFNLSLNQTTYSFNFIKCDSTGKFAVAVGNITTFYYTSNYGSTWTSATLPSNGTNVAVYSNGTIANVIITMASTSVYIGYYNGSTWSWGASELSFVSNTTSKGEVIISRDNSYIYMFDANGLIVGSPYTSDLTTGNLLQSSYLKLYYRFNCDMYNMSTLSLANLASGSIVYDSTATISNIKSFVQIDSSFNYALDGTYGVSLSPGISMPATSVGTGFAISLWIKTKTTTAVTTAQDLFRMSGTNGNLMMIMNGGTLQCYLQSNTSWNSVPSFNTSTFYDMNWHHIVFTETQTGSNGVSNNATITWYIDNVSKGTLTDSYPTTAVTYTSGVIGWASGSEYFTGYIDNVRFFTKPLTVSDVNTLYTNRI